MSQSTPAAPPSRAQGKVFAGARLRHLRTLLGLAQVDMAKDLGISASYLNLMERNHRPLSAQVLVKLAATYDIDVRTFADDVDRHLPDRLAGALAGLDRAGEQFTKQQLTAFCEDYPVFAETLAGLAERSGADPEPRRATALTALTDVSEVLAARGGYFHALEEAGEHLRASAVPETVDPGLGLAPALAADLQRTCGITVLVIDAETMGGMVRRDDHHNRRLYLSEALAAPSRVFEIAEALVRRRCVAAVEAETEAAKPATPQARRLLHRVFCRYIAAAVVMPYATFAAAARTARYDVDVLKARFAVSFEHVAQRLTSLRRPGDAAPPMAFLRLTRSGLLAKRVGDATFPFARTGAHCPRWTAFAAFTDPGRAHIDVLRGRDGRVWLTVAQAERRPGGAVEACVLAVDARGGDKIVYADGRTAALEAAPELGPDCARCRLADCAYRAQPPADGGVVLDPHTRWRSRYVF